jgi:hypothetical protein
MIETPSNMMKSFHIERTNNHVRDVQRYGRRFEAYVRLKKIDFPLDEFLKNLQVHDADKYSEPLLTPYCFITWTYKMKQEGKSFEVSAEMKDKMHEATVLHVKNGKHHSEFWSPDQENLISKENRDGPIDKLIDSTKMPDLYLAEMVCDWCAVGEERGNSPYEWAKKTIEKRWHFTEAQIKTIYSYLDGVITRHAKVRFN